MKRCSASPVLLGKANQNCYEISLPTHYDDHNKTKQNKKWKVTSVDEDVEKLEPFYIAGGNVK